MELEVTGKPSSNARTVAANKQTKQTKNQPTATQNAQNGAASLAVPSGAIDTVALLDKLNNAQRRAVTSAASTVAILAGPGSGKTHTLTSRVAWLIDQVGYAPPNVIVATFTVKAAREMKERIGKVLGGGREKRIVLGTFHSVSLRYLSAYGTRIGIARGFSIVDDGDAKSILKRIIKRLNLTLEPAAARGYISKKKSKGCLGVEGEDKRANHNNKAKAARGGGGNNDEAAHSDDVTTKLEAVRDEYQKHLQSLNLLDFDDLLIRCTELLRAYPACVANVQAVLIDEYQDTNGIQFELMKLFAQHCHRITVVGDPDQSIYGWRSAEITNLSRFLADYPHTVEIALEENYRSSRCILGTSLQVIQQDQERYDKSLLAVHKKGTLPVLRRLQDAPSEARWIVQEIHRATLLSGSMLNHGDVAILVRSAALSRPIEQALARAGIPYRMIGGRKFFERAEVRLLVDYLRIVNQPSNNEVLSRIINVPRRGIGPKTIAKCLEEAETNDMSLWTLITKHCRGERVAEAGITAPAEKKMSRFIGLIQRMQRRLRGIVEEEEGGVGDEEDVQDKVEDDDDDDDDDDEDDNMEKEDTSATDATNKAADAKDARPRQTKPKTKTGMISDAFDAAMDKPYNLVELITALTEQLNYRDYIGETFGGDEDARWANVDEFVVLAREFMANAPALMAEDELPVVDGMEQTKETSVLNKFLANISLAADADKKKEEEEEAANGGPVPMVTISTIHAAKGLEWPVVFIPAAYEGSLPHSRSDDINEERRLLYVAMTRAKCLLNVSYSLFGSPDRNKERGEGRRSEQCLSPFLAGIVDVWFAERGPSFDRALLDEMGDILGRAVPRHGEIYKSLSLPVNVPLEDDVFPLDPLEESRYQNEDEDGGYEYGSRFRRGGDQQQEKTAKRRKMINTPNYNTGGGGGGGVLGGNRGPWQRGYTTTMEGGGTSFTMGPTAAYPGFTTASAHQTALLAAEAEAAAAAAEAAQQAEGEANRWPSTTTDKDRRRRGALPTGQQTIMQSFTRSNSTSSTTAAPPVFQRPPPQLQQSVSLPLSSQLPSGIPAELRGHSLGSVRGNMLPKLSAASASTASAAKSAPVGKQYAHFSSSPTRADALPVQEQPPQHLHNHIAPQTKQPQPFGFNPPRPYRAPSRPAIGKENMGMNTSGVRGVAGAKAAGVGGAVPTTTAVPTPSRPAASFHTTSYAQVQSHGNARKRPAMNMTGGAGGGMAPMAKLCKPFKPPSITRP
ncbi:ATP-dependent DNA helicase srs2 [Sporothrix curviconia]|uniref:DNA 3'-5' helicase n=1 Tax=Sporothrix curviconia TaxID=1260050 RepID=A0ABP0AV74_9PEZI